MLTLQKVVGHPLVLVIGLDEIYGDPDWQDVSDYRKQLGGVSIRSHSC